MGTEKRDEVKEKFKTMAHAVTWRIVKRGVVTNASDLMKLLPASSTGATWLSLTLEDVNNLGQIVGHALGMNSMTYMIEEISVVFSPAP